MNMSHSNLFSLVDIISSLRKKMVLFSVQLKYDWLVMMNPNGAVESLSHVTLKRIKKDLCVFET